MLFRFVSKKKKLVSKSPLFFCSIPFLLPLNVHGGVYKKKKSCVGVRASGIRHVACHCQALHCLTCASLYCKRKKSSRYCYDLCCVDLYILDKNLITSFQVYSKELGRRSESLYFTIEQKTICRLVVKFLTQSSCSSIYCSICEQIFTSFLPRIQKLLPHFLTHILFLLSFSPLLYYLFKITPQ